MSKRYSTAEFCSKAQKIHGGRYDYSEVRYETAKHKVKIFCKKHSGFFSQAPGEHLGGAGCPLCNGGAKISTSDFIQKAIKVHGNRYAYPLTLYKNAHSPVKIYCKVCRVHFSKSPTHHLNGQGCQKCVGRMRHTTESFIAKARSLHGDAYTYDLATFQKYTDKVWIFCNYHQPYFSKSPANHLKGQGCPECSKSGFKKSIPALLYYIRVMGRYKIGVTNRTLSSRFSPADLEKITVIRIWGFGSGSEALEKEQQILKKFEDARYFGPPLLASGNTELFNYDILGEDDGA